MKEPINIGDVVEGTHGKMQRVDDFLPRPEDLVLKKAVAPKTKKITLVLDDITIAIFKEEAKKLNAAYQPMIRKLLFEYALKISEGAGHKASV